MMSEIYNVINSYQGINDSLEIIKKNTKKLSPAPKQKWLEALRSGSYSQTKGFLHTVTYPYDEINDNYNTSPIHCYCCLGVLCEVSEIEKAKPSRESSNSFIIAYSSNSEKEDESETGLPETFQKFVNIDPEVSNALAQLNDFGAYTFEMIADLIEQYL